MKRYFAIIGALFIGLTFFVGIGQGHSAAGRMANHFTLDDGTGTHIAGSGDKDVDVCDFDPGTGRIIAGHLHFLDRNGNGFHEHDGTERELCVLRA